MHLLLVFYLKLLGSCVEFEALPLCVGKGVPFGDV